VKTYFLPVLPFLTFLFIISSPNAWSAIEVSEARNVLAIFEQEVISRVAETFHAQFEFQYQTNMIFPQPYVAASANRSGMEWNVAIWGASTLHPKLTRDGFVILVCHELGHHFGGAPFKKEDDGSMRWSSAEGQADFYATSVCAKRMFGLLPAGFFESFSYPDDIKSTCSQQFKDRDAIQFCIRSILGSKSFTDSHQVARTVGIVPDAHDGHYGYPSNECRMQTLRTGALCAKLMDVRTDDLLGTSRRDRYCAGVRPSCWYAPEAGLSIY
jgi:hypothetical protein